MARKRASMREGPLAELFRATEAAQRQGAQQDRQPQMAVHKAPVSHLAAPDPQGPQRQRPA